MLHSRGVRWKTLKFTVWPVRVKSFVFYCAESEPTAVYSAVRTEDVTYGQITIRPKKVQLLFEFKRSKLIFPAKEILKAVKVNVLYEKLRN